MSRRLSEQQIAAIEFLALPNRGGLTYGEIADKVGVDERTLRRWRNSDKFYDELKRAVVRKTIDRLPEVVESVPDHIIKDGNAAMFRTFLQMHGLLTDKVEDVTKRAEGNVDIEEMKRRIMEYRKADN